MIDKFPVQRIAAIAMILVVSFGVYLNALSGEFVYDDLLIIPDNPWLRDIRHLPKILFSGAWAYSDHDQISNYYRPLAFLIYMIDFHLFGLDPWGYHLTSVLLHTGVSILVFLIAGVLMQEMHARHTDQAITVSGGQVLLPLIAGLLFATHPIHSEPVMWISGIMDILYSLFYLLAFFAYIKGGSTVRNTLAPVLFFIACLGKEPALTLPIMLFAYDAVVKRDVDLSVLGILRLLKIYTPFILAALAYFAMRVNAIGEFAPVKLYQELSTYELFINIFPLFSQYLGKLVLPVNLNVFYAFYPISSLLNLKGLGSALAFICYVGACFRLAQINRMLAFCLIWIAIPLLPVLYIPALGESPFAERYLYLPSVGLVLLLAFGLEGLKVKLFGARQRQQWAMILAAIAIIVLYGVAASSRSNAWQSNIAIWTDSVNKDPRSNKSRMNLGDAYLLKGNIAEAIRELEAAVRYNAESDAAHYSLGEAYSRAGRFDEAVEEYKWTLRIKPSHHRALSDLGVAYVSIGNLDAAIGAFQTALSLKRDYFEAHHNLGAVYGRKGLHLMAIQEFEAAVRLKPDHVGARFHLGIAYNAAGRTDEATQAFQDVLRMQPSHEGSRKMLKTFRPAPASI